MNLYYHPNPKEEQILSQEESAHLIKVLRSKEGDEFWLIDGKGHLYKTKILEANFRKCKFEIIHKEAQPKKDFYIHIAIAPTKNTDRLEWFVEKACELGADEISIIQTQRTERTKINWERLEKKTIGAMKQSKNYWKCKINEMQKLTGYLQSVPADTDKYVAFVETGKEHLLQEKLKAKTDTLILIGPEGDFTREEIELAKQTGFEPVSLGHSVLRTETAGVVAVHTVNLVNRY